MGSFWESWPWGAILRLGPRGGSVPAQSSHPRSFYRNPGTSGAAGVLVLKSHPDPSNQTPTLTPHPNLLIFIFKTFLVFLITADPMTLWPHLLIGLLWGPHDSEVLSQPFLCFLFTFSSSFWNESLWVHTYTLRPSAKAVRCQVNFTGPHRLFPRTTKSLRSPHTKRDLDRIQPCGLIDPGMGYILTPTTSNYFSANQSNASNEKLPSACLCQPAPGHQCPCPQQQTSEHNSVRKSLLTLRHPPPSNSCILLAHSISGFYYDTFITHGERNSQKPCCVKFRSSASLSTTHSLTHSLPHTHLTMSTQKRGRRRETYTQKRGRERHTHTHTHKRDGRGRERDRHTQKRWIGRGREKRERYNHSAWLWTNPFIPALFPLLLLPLIKLITSCHWWDPLSIPSPATNPNQPTPLPVHYETKSTGRERRKWAPRAK